MVAKNGEAGAVRTTIFTVGSRGDVQPYVALGCALSELGLDVTVATHEPFREFVTDRGVGFAALPGDPREMLATPEAQEMLRSGVGLVRFARRFVGILEPWFWKLVAAVTPIHARSDAVLYSALAFPAWHLAQVDRTPTIQLSLQPLLPTSAFPAITTSFTDLGSLGNRLSHRINQQLFWQPLRSAVDQWRVRDLGLPRHGVLGPYGQLTAKREPIVHGFSRHLVPPPPDWPDYAIVSGHWPLRASRSLPGETAAWLDDGQPPIYVGFGSVRDSESERLASQAIEAASRAGVRLVLDSGWTGLGGADGDRVHVVSDTDHAVLFPRMSAVVHHGGAGTTHTAAAAGVPSMAVPYYADQPFWGRRLEAVGIGAPPLLRRRLGVDALAERFKALDHDRVRAQAKRVGKAIRAERGLETATEFITRRLNRD
ncbi:MAG: glycosyltransferase [Gemmatimonadetes bacterium]|nr:glycosyltransferase [Gemmatimonadota bacterium]